MAELSALRLHWTVWAGPYLGAGALASVVAGIVFARGRGHARRPFLVLLASVGLSLLTTGLVLLAADARTALRLARVAQAAAVWIAPPAVAFAAATTGRRLGRELAWSAGLSVAASALSFSPWVIAGVRAYPFGFAGAAGPLYPVALGALCCAFVAPVVFAQQLRVERRPIERRQLPTLLAASVVGGLALVDVLPILGADTPPIGWVPLVSAMMAFLFAMIRYRLLDVRVVVQRLATWVVLTLVGAAPFVALSVAMARRLRGEPLALGLLFAALLIGMRAYVLALHPRLERLIGRRRFDLDAEAALLANQVGTLQSTDELGRAIDRFLAAVDRRLAALVVIDPSGKPRVALSAWGSVPPPSRGSPLLVELASARALLSRDRARGPARLEIERACVRWGAEFLGPLVEGDTLHGLIAISPKQGGGTADALELEALDRLCVTVTAALAGARLYERLRALARELEQKAEARRQSLAQALADLRGAEARLVESEKLASLGQIVAGVAAELGEQVEGAFVDVARLRDHAELLTVAAEEARAARPALADAAFDEASRDVGPLLDAVSEGARRAHGIVADLTRFAPDPSSSPSPAAVRRATGLGELVDRTLTLVSSQLRGVTLARDYDAALPPVVVEPGPLGQVVLNLLLNAAEAMRGAGTLTVATRRAGAWAELTVADSGPGIPPDVLPRIFEPFFTTKGPTSGTGLGLWISYGIVARHGGRITVESAVGQGTRFRIQLPIE
jgi:signal transduction histidine kinase